MTKSAALRRARQLVHETGSSVFITRDPVADDPSDAYGVASTAHAGAVEEAEAFGLVFEQEVMQ